MGDQKSEWQAEELIGNHTLQRDSSGSMEKLVGKGGGWRYMEDAAGPGKKSCTKSESKNSRTRVGRQKEGSEAESLRSPGMWAFLVGHKLPFCPLLPGDQ